MIEDKIQEAIKPIISLYNQIELELIEKIAEHFNLNQQFINSDYWYFEKLEELGSFNNETIKLLEKYTNKTRKELLKAMNDIGIESIPREQLNIATQEGYLLNPDTIINNINIQNIIKHSYNEIEKSFLQLNKTIVEQIMQTYQNILTRVYVKTNAGICTYQTAILESLDELGNKGISILTYQDKNGTKKNYDIVGTVRRDLLVATRGLAAKVNEEVIKESGWHIVRVSHHFGARTGDGGENYTNHAWWQEKQFFCWNYDGKATEEEKKLPDFMEYCNYGDVQGIVGINCKHFFTVWYGSLEKDKFDFTYQENEEQYKMTQQQRYLESGVRKWKRKQVIADKSENKEGYEKASEKAREWQDRLSDFTNRNDFKRDYSREHIKDYKAMTIKNKDDIILNIEEEKAINDYISSDSYKINEKLRNNIKLDAHDLEFVNNLDSALNKCKNYEGNIIRVLDIANAEDLQKFVNKNQIGKTITFNEYLSFSNKENYNNQANVYIYIYSKNGKDIRQYNPEESEILYSRNSKFLIENIIKEKGKYYILWRESSE